MATTTLGRLPRFRTIGHAEKTNLMRAMRSDLSGYLGGVVKGGYWCERLAEEWQAAFKVKYAVPCNSATSGLLAACMAAGINKDSVVWTTAMSMSATAACAKVLGAHVVFIDIETMRFSMNMNNFRGTPPKAIIVANLFGHPAYLSSMRSWCDSNNVIMIEDNAQSPFAMENGRYAGTIGHMGVFSLNVHKHIQCGEGGVVVTSDDNFRLRLLNAINHGELSGDVNPITGLNLRMVEPVAAIACAQLAKGPKIVEGRRELAAEITDMFSHVQWIQTPVEDVGCKHVYYMWAARVYHGYRSKLVAELTSHGFPVREGYSKPLNLIFPSMQGHDYGIGPQPCPVAERMEDEEIMCFEICAYDPMAYQIRKMREIVKRAIAA